MIRLDCMSINARRVPKQLKLYSEDFNPLQLCRPCIFSVKKVVSGFRNGFSTSASRSVTIPMMSCYSVKPTYVVRYSRRADGMGFSRKVVLMPLDNKPNGWVSKKSAKKIRLAINWMLLFSKRKSVFSVKEGKSFTFVLAFITLTLSDEQRHTDEYVKRHLLKPFLKWLSRNGCAMYVWKAEAQSNGRVHFHITVNNFIHWKSIRKKWNDIQSKHGYHKVFTQGRSEIGLNSTDVHSVKNERDTAAYMAKYMTKNERNKGKRDITGRLWGCSENLSNISCVTNDHNSEEVAGLSEWMGLIDYKYFKDEYVEFWGYRHLKYLKHNKILAQLLSPLFESRQNILNSQQLLIEVPTFF